MLLMATKRPRTTISFDPEEYEQLRRWAESEFRTIPQLVSAIVKKSLLERSEDLKPGDKA
ncbi:hypothetical protein NIES4072_74000 [Nostoc commune NIES-4072]|jgi:hypothetical protein|uniref:Uncharacterized protein n=2 Tax=Nostoc TaxID=1177 RepID=A0A2R5G1T9_NOSCO|nr:hypothetical protein NIES4070_73990 [Nostoc commune HK-02]GBG23688.1 hypothetical protein NIES4072_74000 [Nostoc commune NIES-4072]